MTHLRHKRPTEARAREPDPPLSRAPEQRLRWVVVLASTVLASAATILAMEQPANKAGSLLPARDILAVVSK